MSSSLLVATIAAMHLIGMYSLHKNASLHYQLTELFVAILILFTGSYISFRWIAHMNTNQQNHFTTKLKSALALGLGVAGFHYILMYDGFLSPLHHHLQENSSTGNNMGMTILALYVGAATVIILIIVLISSYVEGKFLRQALKLKTNEQYYQSLFYHNPDLIITFDTKGYFLGMNHVVEAYGYSETELRNRPFAPLIVPEMLETALENYYKAASGTATNYDTAFYNKFGERIEVNVTNLPIIVDGEIVGVYGIHKDITRHKQDQQALAEAELKYRSLAEDAIVGIYIMQDGRLVYANPQLASMTGYSVEELIGSDVTNYIVPEDLSVLEKNTQKILTEEMPALRYVYRIVNKDQSILQFEIHASKTLFQGKPAIIGSIIDITEQKLAQEKIKYLAFHDALTGLPNRYKFNSRFQEAMMHQEMKSAAILFLDLDRFKLINDTLGHDTGDQLLKEIADKLATCITPKDCLARIGGDEFILFMPQVDRPGVIHTAERMLAALNKPIHIKGLEMFITPSIGISLYPHDDKEVGNLIKKADLAMHQAKRMGKNNYQFYQNQSIETTNERFELEHDLRKAVEREEFVLYYQPKTNIQSGALTGMEALIRWQHPDKGIISPDQFIPLAEETGLIVPIGEWVLRTACKQLKGLLDTGFPPVLVSVNLSLRQFFQPDFIGMVKSVLAETGLSPEYVELEMTESMMIDTHHALKIVRDLKKLGVKISLDDFGTGYSSLHYLKEFPVDTIKIDQSIDQSFVRDSLTNGSNATIVKTIIAMAHQLKMTVIAEGVETKEQLTFLQQHLCDSAQGYLFSKPRPLEEIIKSIDTFKHCVKHV
ncbi:EAL domain-containing protein [Neobacillus dielmonensis]|uniref:EAL domain-containing protein n=1 Tax=Neobacillus dielmonensis TaxID=1347369 RepID=UPI001F1D7BCE|nr:EAL domain-containing protein [Neobacillus dielmonensis]